MLISFRRLIRYPKAESRRALGSFAPGSNYIPTGSRTHPLVTCTMVPKRKRSAVAPQQDIQPELPERPNATPRRSGRIVKKPSEVSQSDAYPSNKEALRAASSQTRGKKKQMLSQGEDVYGAIDGLREMEDNFRDAVKRQKLALDESSLCGTLNTTDEDAPFMPRPIKANPDTVLTKSEKKLLKERAAVKNEINETGLENGAHEDREEGDAEEPDANAFKQEGSRPPPVNSDYLPLPWKGRIGYACLNTYLRQSNPPVFSSRTCRISSILDHRHPLRDPSQPEHPTKNRPDKDEPADVARGKKYVEALGLANARDIVKMVRWNDKYGIKFMRLSSEMFPFASHEEYGYKLAPFASEALAEAGRVAGELGHRLTTHPGQFTQLGSPRKEVVRNAIRDLEYHDEMLTLLRLPEQPNKDAVMILHMGGVFGDKEATLDRFRENYAGLSPGIKARLVLENDDVSWTVHDLLPICEELNIPLVLDFHHHNIMFDKDKIREGTKDIVELYPRIKATWDRKGITQKMHYSEPCSEAITPRQRRKHRPRVMTLPPCANDMDLMIEAKDKEQAVFDLMRNFKLPGWDRFNDVIPYEREDDNRPPPKVPKKKQRKNKNADENGEDGEPEEEAKPLPVIPESEVGMGGPDNRVYWPLGMEEWLRPKKREVKNSKSKGDEIGDD
ncbi:UV-endonuclease UvdE [Annulohypoxylon truncatum]|uniref:UV-endonuclease UvdE n=1 Tax=Annulohypoxylon truncatum TaxID=327061 RepID=UPI0020082765|nr:UV-endonuclease UvdE [Annulohypoxylon truncatum]KAI1206889.1 UV-endonuclease UvdE [Annulohypoxylon truncatum]